MNKLSWITRKVATYQRISHRISLFLERYEELLKVDVLHITLRFFGCGNGGEIK